MARRDLMADLMAQYRRLDPDNIETPAPAPEPEHAPTAVHAQVVAVLHDLLATVAPSAETGPAGMLIKGLRVAEPMLLRDIGRVPDAQLIEFINDLGRRLVAIGQPNDERSAATG